MVQTWCEAEGELPASLTMFGVVIPRVLGTGSALLYAEPAGSADKEPARLLQSLSLPNYFWLPWKPQGLQRDGAGFAQGCLPRSPIPASQPMVVHQGFGKGSAKQLQKTLQIYYKCTFPHRQRQGKWRGIKGLKEQWKFSFFSLFFGCK